MDNALPSPFLDSEARRLEDEARRITALAGRSESSITDDVLLPFRVPRENDPSIWSIRVDVGGPSLSLSRKKC